jgi:hypothetical protein
MRLKTLLYFGFEALITDRKIGLIDETLNAALEIGQIMNELLLDTF